jgi:hypothetical protein
MDMNEIKDSLMRRQQKFVKDINLPSFSIVQRRYSNQRISDVKFVFFNKKSDALLLNDESKALNTYTTEKAEGTANNTDTVEIKEKYDKLYDKYLKLISEINQLKDENQKLKLLAYKSYDDLKEESAYEISRATMEKDSLLILMELRKNRNLNYVELQDRITRPGNLFPRLSELFHINFITPGEKNGDFSITSSGIEFLEKRGL